MNLQSNKTKVNKSSKELFEFLIDTSHFKDLMPDSLEGFEVTEDSFKFDLKGMPPIKMVYTEKTPHHTIGLKVASDAFPIFLTCKIAALTANQCEVQLFMEGEINMMMAMMIKKPLQNLLDTLAEKMTLL
jgi:carbon monoxide dehydrogenase subunit G